MSETRLKRERTGQHRLASCTTQRARSEPSRVASWMAVVALLALSLAAGACNREQQRAATGAELYELCASCHGVDGSGNESLAAPAIAGLDVKYLETQITKFRNGVRGAHPDDRTGLMMRPMGRSLRSEAEVRNVAEYVASLGPKSPTPTLQGGSAEEGAARYVACQLCHGQQGEGNLERQAPALVHANDWYLLAQLSKFKAGVRAGTAEDVEGVQMVPWAASLPDDQAMKDVVAYIQTLRAPKGL